MARTAKVVAPPAKITFTREEAIRNITRSLTWMVERGNETRDRIVAKMQESLYSAEYEIRWLQGRVRPLQNGMFARSVLDNIESTESALTFEEKLQQSVEYFQGKLDIWYPENSTSPFSNACRLEEYNTLKEFLRELKGFVAHVKDSEILV